MLDFSSYNSLVTVVTEHLPTNCLSMKGSHGVGDSSDPKADFTLGWSTREHNLRMFVRMYVHHRSCVLVNVWDSNNQARLKISLEHQIAAKWIFKVKKKTNTSKFLQMTSCGLLSHLKVSLLGRMVEIKKSKSTNKPCDRTLQHVNRVLAGEQASEAVKIFNMKKCFY